MATVKLIPRDPQDQWQPGHNYRLSYDVKAPVLVSASALQVKVDQAITQFAADPRLRLLRYSFNRTAGTLDVDVLAVAPASPIAVVGYALLGIGLLVAITFTFRAVAQLLDAGSTELPGGVKLSFPFLALVGGVLLFAGGFLRRGKA